MSWWKDLSELHVKLATVFEKIGGLAENVGNLSDDQKDFRTRLGRVEGAVANSANPEILRQLSVLSDRVSKIETSIANGNTNGELVAEVDRLAQQLSKFSEDTPQLPNIK